MNIVSIISLSSLIYAIRLFKNKSKSAEIVPLSAFWTLFSCNANIFFKTEMIISTLFFFKNDVNQLKSWKENLTWEFRVELFVINSYTSTYYEVYVQEKTELLSIRSTQKYDIHVLKTINSIVQIYLITYKGKLKDDVLGLSCQIWIVIKFNTISNLFSSKQMSSIEWIIMNITFDILFLHNGIRPNYI